MSKSLPTFRKIASIFLNPNYDKYPVLLCVFGLVATAIMLTHASSYFKIESIWILSPFVFFCFISLIFKPKDEISHVAWKVALTLWVILDAAVKYQITYLPGSSTDGIAWLFLPVYAMPAVLTGFGLSYLTLLAWNKFRS